MDEIARIGSRFRLEGEFSAAEPYGGGHINDTFRAEYRLPDGGRIRYLHQRINQSVFPDPVAVMENIDRVSAWLQQRIAEEGLPDPERRCLQVIPTRDGRAMYLTPEGEAWRTYNFVEGASTWEVVQSPAMAREAARAFGRFQRLLVDLPGPRLNEVLHRFHHTPERFQQFEDAFRKDPQGRAVGASPEIEFALRRVPLCHWLLDLYYEGEAPERITHNDTKLNNVMIDDATGEGICVVDLETVMPGLSLYDFGDLARTASTRASEDEQDLARVRVDPELFLALAEGYLAETRSFLTEAEQAHLVTSGMVITFEVGLRFLADHLRGDEYFRIHRPGHNLERARTQFALVRSMEEQRRELEELLHRRLGLPRP